MCGIIGTIGKNTTSLNVDKFLKQALICDAVRGTHSTGVVTLFNKGGKPFYSIEKEAVNGTEFVRDFYDPTSDNVGVHTVIGHNRYATVGGTPTRDTAHPFKVGNIIGVHNGTLTGDWHKDLSAPKSMTVDSNAMMHSLEYRGPKKTFSSMSGAVATVWTDIKSHKTFCYRNSQRPLHYAITLSGAMVYASEKLMLAWLLDRNNINIKGEIEPFKINTVYEITGGDPVELMTVTTKSSPAPRSWQNTYNSTAADYNTPASTTVSSNTLPDHGVSGRYITEVEIEKMTGLFPVLGGDTAPSQSEMYGGTFVQIKTMPYLPIRVPLGMSNDSLRSLGYKRQGGVFYRENQLTEFEIRAGIIAEFAELGAANAEIHGLNGDDDLLICDHSLLPIEGEYLETGDTHNGIILHPSALQDWREQHGDFNTGFLKIIRRNVVHKMKLKEDAA